MTRTLLALVAVFALTALASAKDPLRGGIKDAPAGWPKPICIGGRCYPPRAKFTLDQRVDLIAALRKGRLTAKAQDSIAGLLIGARGAELTELKNRIDATGGGLDLHSLVYTSLRDEALRKKVLGHFAAEAKSAPSDEVKVLSGVLNTFVSARSDARYPARTVYPGVREFYRALDENEKGRRGDLTYFTGQPSLTAEMLRRQLMIAGVEGPMIPNSVTDMRSDAASAKAKLRHVQQVQALYPEYKHVFAGDSGPVDHAVARRLYAHNPRALRGVFVHDVTGIDAGTRERLGNYEIMVFDNYAQAGRLAYERGLISRAALQRVADATERELREITFRHENKRLARDAELRAELKRIADLPAETTLTDSGVKGVGSLGLIGGVR